jgi:hypothetical protein
MRVDNMAGMMIPYMISAINTLIKQGYATTPVVSSDDLRKRGDDAKAGQSEDEKKIVRNQRLSENDAVR